MIKIEVERKTLRHFSLGVRSESVRNLKFLRDIDGAITWLRRLTSKIQADATFAENLSKEIRFLTNQIDKNGELLRTFEAAQTEVHGVYKALIAKRQSARNDPRLTEEDGIEFFYDEAIAAAADLHNNLNILKWAIAEHDADLSPVSKTYDNMEELLADLES